MRKVFRVFVFSCFFVFLPSLVLAVTADDLRRAGLDEVTVSEIIKQAELAAEIKKLDQEIQAKKDEINATRRQGVEYQQVIAQKQKESASLKNQLAILENRINKTEVEIMVTKKTAEAAEVEIKSLELKQQEAASKIAAYQEQISQLLFKLYKERRKNALEVVFLYQSFADFFNGLMFNQKSAENLRDLLKRVELSQATLEAQQSALKQKQDELASLNQRLDEQKIWLEEEERGKQNFLNQTKASEAKYQKLLASLKAEQEAIESDIESLEEKFRAKLVAKGQLNGGAVALTWPVPKAGITAYFHDPTYLFRKVFEHPAIDIRTLKDGRSSNGLPVRAAENGYVAKAKDAGLGYSYVMILHNQDFSTVYGHVSKILVKEGDYVTQGQVIALSGGMPGTPGAGRLTTGPHLHFEVRVKAVPVDPLAYLP